MAARYYTVQRCHSARGWEDIGIYSIREKPCIDHAKEYVKITHYQTRVIRKPHGFVPSDTDTVL